MFGLGTVGLYHRMGAVLVKLFFCLLAVSTLHMMALQGCSLLSAAVVMSWLVVIAISADTSIVAATTTTTTKSWCHFPCHAPFSGALSCKFSVHGCVQLAVCIRSLVLLCSCERGPPRLLAGVHIAELPN